MHTHMNGPNSSLDWVFVSLGPIPLCVDSFLCVCITVYCMYVCVVLQHGEVDLVGLKPILRTTSSFSALTLLVGSFDP